MGHLCDFCGEQRSMIYCRSDAASLCLSCDRNVHSANALSKRHSRTLVCERCNSQPAFVRCVEEGVSLCQNCDQREHAASTSSSSNKKQLINSYTGCPSAEELSTIWSFLLDTPASLPDGSTCEQGMGLLSIEENSLDNGSDPTLETGGFSAIGKPDDAQSSDKSGFWMGCSSTPEFVTANNLDQPSGSGKTVSPKTYYSGIQSSGTYEDELFALLDIDDFDMDIQNYDELFGLTPTHSEQLLENGGIDNLFTGKDISAADSCCQTQSTAGAEGSAGVLNAVQPEWSNGQSADSTMSIKTEPPICFGARQAHSSVSFSGLAVESTGADYQDCGASSMYILGEPPWCPPESSLLSANRNDAVMRYREKKKSRKFEKKVRYASRKARADVRKRVKGRFIKAGDAYDYDPLSETRSY